MSLVAVCGVKRRGERIPASDNFGELKSICRVARSRVLARIEASMSETAYYCRAYTRTHDISVKIEVQDSGGRSTTAVQSLLVIRLYR